jgi:osmoprotectant transport system permease protein
MHLLGYLGGDASLFSYLGKNGEHVLSLTFDHALLVLVSLGFSVVIGIASGVLVYRANLPRTIVLAIFGVFLTLPSYALFVIFIGPLGLGVVPSVVALTMYGLLPIARNTVVGLRGVDPAVSESAVGMGMGYWRRLVRIDLPLAWPVIVTGVRVAAQLLIGIAAIAGFVDGPGLGKLMLDGLNRVGTQFAVPIALSGVVGVIVLAIAFDIFFVLVVRLTTPRGIRA